MAKAVQTKETSILELPELTPDLYLNRELSWLDFNLRVLEEMEEDDKPLLERVKFSAIFSSNLDEFFMIRVAGVKRKVVNHVSEPGLDGRTPVEVHRAIHDRVQDLLGATDRVGADGRERVGDAEDGQRHDAPWSLSVASAAPARFRQRSPVMPQPKLS